ncbi:hypothetical protein RJ640_002413 [Escallonia rubra]|uniref:Uncharacterized protein n=1 Tax=Escallonia rubra TaxID=112253 RepID=A0AA88RKT0_9ASTE|nr:hypothetical protein RJ640_013316 [Escallonia rubra]KAK2980921.1 hypothetical protein RJ640_002413 [Escallonia rubra]
MGSSMCSSAHDPQVRTNMDPTFDSLVGSSQSRGGGADHHGSSLLKNLYILYQCMDSYLASTDIITNEI